MAFVTNFKHQQKTAGEYRDEQKAKRAKAQRDCYADVDQRDGGHDRVTGEWFAPGVRHHHHMIPRSRGGRHTTDNVVTVGPRTHESIHAGKLHLSGNADERDHDGKLCGVQVEKIGESGWDTVAWV